MATKGTVTVFGGSGFLGRHVVRRLARDGWLIRVAVRHPAQAEFMQPMGEFYQVNPIHADIRTDASVASALQGAHAVVNLVGIMHQKRHATFHAVHVEGAERIARLAKQAGAGWLVHISALGADSYSDSVYARTKGEGEEAVRRHFPEASILRPSVLFGPEDDFLNRFARMARLSPFLPVFTKDGLRIVSRADGLHFDRFGSGGPKFQPVFVGDVGEAVAACLNDAAHQGKIFELGGPEIVTMKQIMELVLRESGRKRALLPLPMWLGDIQSRLMQVLPHPPLTPDQMKLLRRDNVVSGRFPGLAELGIIPTTLEAIVPSYLRPFGPSARRIGATTAPRR